eukprot:Gb_05151 [translate_table: standard]
MQSTNDVMKNTLSAMEKWRATEEFCSQNGVIRTPIQCRDRWEHIQPEYKRIRDYENNIPSGHDSYWNMTGGERIAKKLPSNYIEEIFEAMEKSFGYDRAINPRDIVVDTFATNYGASEEPFTPFENNPLQESTSPEIPSQCLVNSLNVKEKQSTRKKRKTMSKIAGIKDVMTENNRLIISTLELAEEGHMKRHERYCVMFEQRLQKDDVNEQRMINVEE